MVEINLLPWRADSRAKKKKFAIGVLLTLCIGLIFWWAASVFGRPVTAAPRIAQETSPKKVFPRTKTPAYKIIGYLHQNNRTWGIAKYATGEIHELTSFTLPPQDQPHHFLLEVQKVNLADILRILAKFLHWNIELNPNISGLVSLHLEDIDPQAAFNVLINSHGLTKIKVGNIWYITTRKEFIEHQEEEKKWQDSLDKIKPLTTQVWQIQYAKAEDIARLLQDNNSSLLSQFGHVRVDSRTNTLCVQELPERLTAVHRLIQQFDIPVQQVLIEARLASVDSDFERDLGIHYSVQQLAPTVGGAPHFSLAVAKLADGSLLDVTLAAMENEGHGELIASPSLFTANQQTASIESGEEIPYQEVSRSGGTGVAFKKAVLRLKVTPQILPGNQVLLQLQVNQDRPSSRIVLGVPAITTRQITTNILVKSGQTLVLGGIYELNKEHNEQRIPFLGKIPLVGLLFQQQNAKENKRELLIFVTPKIISTS